MKTTTLEIGETGKATRILFLDLDGTVRKGYDELGKFVNKAEDVEIFDGVLEKMRMYKNNGYRIVGITNQGGVATGQISHKDMVDALIRTNKLTGLTFDKIMVCVHHPDAQDLEMANCFCRKPRIGNLVTACNQLGEIYNEYYPPHLALFVGDRPEDEQCASNAGIQFQVASAWRDNPIIEVVTP